MATPLVEVIKAVTGNMNGISGCSIEREMIVEPGNIKKEANIKAMIYERRYKTVHIF